MNTKELLKTRQTEIGLEAVAAQFIAKDAVIHEFKTPVLKEPTMHSVQFGERVHVEPFDNAEYTSHACKLNNTAFVIDDKKLVYFFWFLVTFDFLIHRLDA